MPKLRVDQPKVRESSERQLQIKQDQLNFPNFRVETQYVRDNTIRDRAKVRASSTADRFPVRNYVLNRFLKKFQRFLLQRVQDCFYKCLGYFVYHSWAVFGSWSTPLLLQVLVDQFCSSFLLVFYILHFIFILLCYSQDFRKTAQNWYINTYKIQLKLNITENLEKSVTNFLELKKTF